MKLNWILKSLVFFSLILFFQNCSLEWQSTDSSSSTPSTIGETFFGDHSKVLSTPNFRLLSNREIKNSLVSITEGKEFASLNELPASFYDPFDNNGAVLVPSHRLTSLMNEFAVKFGEEFAQHDDLIFKYTNCQNFSDESCVRQFIGNLGMAFFRRPLGTAASEDYFNLIKELEPNLGKSKVVEYTVQTMVQDPAFLYKWEIGEKANITGIDVNLYRLNEYQYISRVTFFLLGRGPNLDTLLAISEGELSTDIQIRQHIQTLQKTEEYKSNMVNFFGYWMGFAGLSNNRDPSSREYSMYKESEALIRRSLFEGSKDWTRVFTSKDTFINKKLADIYGFDHSGDGDNFEWVRYTDEDRKGYLAHLSFLSDWETRGDTSTTRRGYHIFKRFFCGHKQPVPADVDVDTEPGGDLETPCKIEREKQALLKPGTSCVGCHNNMNKIGFGIDNYGLDGRFRLTQPSEPSCSIEGTGHVDSVDKSFTGISGLVDAGLSSNAFQSCMTEHLIEYGIGLDIRSDTYSIIGKSLEIQANQTDFSYLVEEILLADEFRYATGGAD